MQLQIDYFRNVVMAMRRLRKAGKVLVYDGWRLCGKGHFSYVFENPKFPSIVIKLGGCGHYSYGVLRSDSYSPEKNIADHWPLYAKLCLKYQGVENVPVIHHVEHLSGTVTWAVLGICNKQYEDKRCNPTKYGNIHAGMVALHYEFSNLVGVQDNQLRVIDAWVEYGAAPSQQETDFLMELVQLMVENGSRIDYHTDNHMEDSDGNTVVTDPICGLY